VLPLRDSKGGAMSRQQTSPRARVVEFSLRLQENISDRVPSAVQNKQTSAFAGVCLLLCRQEEVVCSTSVRNPNGNFGR